MAAEAGKFTLDAQDAASLKAASGLVLSVSSGGPDRPWLSLHGGMVSIGGELSLKGGGAFRTFRKSRFVDIWKQRLAGRCVFCGCVSLVRERNTVRHGSLIAKSQLEARRPQRECRRLGVPVPDRCSALSLPASRLSGTIQVINQEGELRVEPINEPCLLFDTQGVKLGGVMFQPNKLNLCPRKGAFMRPANGDASGTASQRQVVLAL